MNAKQLNKKIDSLIHWKKQIENKIAELQRELAIIEVETPQWENTIEYQIEPETEIFTGKLTNN